MSRDVLVGTAEGIYLLGAHDRPWDLAGERVHGIAGGASGTWAIAGQTTVWFDPGGRRGAPQFDVAGKWLNCVLPTATGALLGASEATLLEVTLSAGEATLDGPDEAFAAAPDRDSWYTPWGGPPDVRSMARDLDGTLYVNVHVGGVLRRRPGGGWEPTLDIDADVHEVVAHPERSGVVVAATARGLALSLDAASTWTFVTDGLHARYARAVAVAGDAVYMSVSSGPGGEHAAVYRADSMGRPFLRCETGMPMWLSTNVNTACVAAFDDTVVIGDAAGTVYRSEDGGHRWTVAADGLPGIECLAVV